MGNLGLTLLGVGIQLAIAYFFPQKIKGPRQENLKAQTSKYGDPIARVYGNVRVAGAVVWLKGNKVDEHKQTKRSKALGPITVNYTYTADFAVAFSANGPVTAIARVWADQKLVYDNGANGLQIAIGSGKHATKNALAKGSSIKTYLGTETQTSDPDIEADIGVGLVPAWPRVVYLVIKNFPLDQFGIRVPNMEAEIICAGQTTAISVDPASDAQDFNDINGSRYASTDVTNDLITLNAIPSGDLIWSTSNGEGIGMDRVLITDRGDVFAIAHDGAEKRVWVFDAPTGAIKASFNYGSSFSDGFGQLDDITLATGVSYVLFVSYLVSRLYKNDGTGWIDLWSGAGEGLGIQTLSLGPEWAYMIVGIATKYLARARWDEASLRTLEFPSIAGSMSGDFLSAYYDQGSDSLVVLTSTNLYVCDAELTTILASTTLGYGTIPTPSRLYSRRMSSGDGLVAVRNYSNNDFHEYFISNLVESRHIVASTTSWTNKGVTFTPFGLNPDWQMAFVEAGFLYWFFPRIERATVALADVISAECGLVDLTVDVSAITKRIDGYTVREVTAPRAVVEDLIRLNFIDFSQQGGALKFVNRTSTTARNIDILDMGAVDADELDNPKIVEETYPDFRELPAKIMVSYPAYNADYRTGTQSIQRPDGIDGTKATLEFTTTMVMSDDEAAQAIDVMFNEMREATAQYKTRLPSKYIDLAAADVVSLPLDSARTVSAAITKIGGETILDTELRLRTIDFTSDAVGTTTPTDDKATLLDIANVDFVPIDGNLLRASDSGDSFYFGVTRDDGGTWQSATVYRSTDGGVSYDPWMGMTDELPRGFATTALPDVAHPEAWDRSSSLTLRMSADFTAPASVSEATLLSNPTLNAFAVQDGLDWEYIRAATVVDNGNGTWSLSKFLRARKGTDFATRNHGAGDRVVYLDPNALDRPPEGDRGLSRIYVPVATGTAFSTTNATSFTNTGRGLRPWSPIDIAGVRDGSNNFVITAIRRDRLGQEWPESGPEDPPMSEATESYKLFVYNGASIVRTITGSSLSFAYSASQQTTDFGSPPDFVTVGIVQVSAVYGDGIERRATIPTGVSGISGSSGTGGSGGGTGSSGGGTGSGSGDPMPTGITGSYVLTFQDNFDGGTLDTSKWNSNWLGSPGSITPPVGGTSEDAAYDPVQVSVNGGNLVLSAIASPVTVSGHLYPYRSGLVNTHGKYSDVPVTEMVYEARIYLQAYSGIRIANFPAFWLDGESWPTDGEIDIVEGLSGGAYGHFHYPGGGPGTPQVAGDPTGWHTWSARWFLGDRIEYYFDGVKYFTITPRGSGYVTALSSPMYIICNLAVKDSNGVSVVPGTIYFDYVRAWKAA